jgi:hypothetical protein
MCVNEKKKILPLLIKASVLSENRMCCRTLCQDLIIPAITLILCHHSHSLPSLLLTFNRHSVDLNPSNGLISSLMTIHDTSSTVQPMRRVYENGRAVIDNGAGTIQIVCHHDASYAKNIILWDDIKTVFGNALYVRSRDFALPFLKGPDFKKYVVYFYWVFVNFDTLAS